MALNPTSGTVAVREDIAGVLNEAGGIGSMRPIGLRILPGYAVNKKKGVIWRLSSKSLMRLPTGTMVAPGGTAKRTNTSLESDSYECETHKLAEACPDENEEEYAGTFSYRLAVAQIKAAELTRTHEKRVYDLVCNITTFPQSGDTGLAVTDEWDDLENSIPDENVNYGARAITKRTGIPQDMLRLAIGLKTYQSMGANKRLRERIGLRYAASAQEQALLTPVQLAAALGIASVEVSSMTYDSANEGQAFSGAFMWDDEYAFLYYAREGQGPLNEPEIGRTLYWDRMGGLFAADQFRDDDAESEVIRVKQSTDEKIFVPEAGFLFTNIKT